VEQSRKRILEVFGKEPGRSVGPIRTTKTALGGAYHFEVALGRTPDAEALAFAVIPRGATGVSLHFRGTRRDLAALPALLGSLEALPEGNLLALPGRYAVAGLSFIWPEPLESPKYFTFESENRARFRIHWEDAQPAFEDVDWSRDFSLPEAPSPSATRIKHGAVPGAAVCPPPGFEPAAVSFRIFAQEGRAKNYEGVSKLHLFAQARAEVGKRFLAVEYFDEAPDVSQLERFYALLRTVHAELPR
jgi:hypothetical protein